VGVKTRQQRQQPIVEAFELATLALGEVLELDGRDQDRQMVVYVGSAQIADSIDAHDCFAVLLTAPNR
jgi:hypothetical protein